MVIDTSALVGVLFDVSERAGVVRAAWRRYGEGRHPASPNYGDGFARALARVRGDELLVTGDNFYQADVAPVVFNS